MKRSQILVALSLSGMLITAIPAQSQQLEKPFEPVFPSRLDLLRHNNQWTEIATKMGLGMTLYETTEHIALAALPPEADRYANEFALVATLAAAVAAEASSFANANSLDGVSAGAKRVDSAFDALEIAGWALQDYVGQQSGLQARLLLTIVLLALDWHYLPERDLRR